MCVSQFDCRASMLDTSIYCVCVCVCVCGHVRTRPVRVHTFGRHSQWHTTFAVELLHVFVSLWHSGSWMSDGLASNNVCQCESDFVRELCLVLTGLLLLLCCSMCLWPCSCGRVRCCSMGSCRWAGRLGWLSNPPPPPQPHKPLLGHFCSAIIPQPAAGPQKPHSEASLG